MSKDVKIVAVYRVTAAGWEPVVGAEPEAKPKRKNSRNMRFFERTQRRLLDAVSTYADESLALHNRSSEKKKDGWVRDMATNQVKATRKAMKKVAKLSPI